MLTTDKQTDTDRQTDTDKREEHPHTHTETYTYTYSTYDRMHLVRIPYGASSGQYSNRLGPNSQSTKHCERKKITKTRKISKNTNNKSNNYHINNQSHNKDFADFITDKLPYHSITCTSSISQINFALFLYIYLSS